ncbi:Hypothetical_protein [Hexamita inflata]|uniref:Hypothetical_protein n=1 Tax=Hexamita inflata TaxID=28002 RepID=A0ABP1HUE0_9EUKA
MEFGADSPKKHPPRAANVSLTTILLNFMEIILSTQIVDYCDINPIKAPAYACLVFPSDNKSQETNQISITEPLQSAQPEINPAFIPLIRVLYTFAHLTLQFLVYILATNGEIISPLLDDIFIDRSNYIISVCSQHTLAKGLVKRVEEDIPDAE